MMIKQQKVILEDNISNLSSASGDLHANTTTSCSENKGQENGSNYDPNHQHYFANPPPSQSQPSLKRKRNLPGNPDPEAEVISLSPKTLMATNRFVCEICSKGFQRDQNLQLHRRGHNLPWKLKQRNKNEIVRKKVYVCPEVNCVHHEPSRALGDLTGIKKHFSRKHGEKTWKCDKCSKRYAVKSDWKAHSKTCGTREYKCDCGTIFSRRDSFITHRAFCDALAEETALAITGIDPTLIPGQIPTTHFSDHLLDPIHGSFLKKETQSQDQECSPSTSHGGGPTPIAYHPAPSAYMSATALLQKAAQMGTTHLSSTGTSIQAPCTASSMRPHHQHYQTQVFGNNNGGTSSSSALINLSSFDPQEMIAMASFGNAKDGGAGGPSLSPAFHHPMSLNSINMMMMMNSDGFADVSTFEDAFSHILDSKKEEKHDHDHDHGNNHEISHSSSKQHHHDHDHHMTMMMMMHDDDDKSDNVGNIGSGVMGNEGMTRDFLGLKAPNHSHNNGMQGN